MATVFMITILVFAAVQGSDNLECNKPNEEVRCVAECPPQKTCRTRDIQVSCLQSATESLEEKCVCKEGYFRNPGGECVTAEDCDKCNAQNQYYSCRTTPDKLCSEFKDTGSGTSEDNTDSPQNSDTSDVDVQANTDGSNTGNSTECKAQCYCNPGTARDENNQCVPYDQCNKPCPQGETKSYCPADDCPAEYCPKNASSSAFCQTPKICPKESKCICYINSRRDDNGTCIPTRECPPFECNKPFEVFDPCPPLCPNGYCGQATPTGRCPPIFGRIGILLICNPRCRCKEGYWWNENKECIPYNQCPGKNSTSTAILNFFF